MIATKFSFNIEELPSPPAVAVKLLDLFNDPDATISDISQVIQVDPALASKVVSYCNSPLIGATRPVDSIDRAIVMLGTSAVRMISLSFSLVEISSDEDSFDYRAFWRNSLATAVASRSVARQFDDNADKSFLIGLLLNIGQIALYRHTSPETKSPSETTIQAQILHENLVFETNRFEVGMQILRQWNFPEDFVDSLNEYSVENFDELAPKFLKTNAAIHLTSLLTGDEPSLDEVEMTKAIFMESLQIPGESFLEIVADSLKAWHEYAELLNFEYDPDATTLREIELTAKKRFMETSIAQMQQQSKLESEIDELKTTVGKDSLTGVNNLRAYQEQAVQDMSRCHRTGRPFSMVVIDIDHFKKCNDEHGHQIGDKALIHVAQLLVGHLRNYDNLYRYGGEEFVVTLPECKREQAVVVAERLRKSVANSPFQAGDSSISLTISLGVVSNESTPDHTLEQLFEIADRRLYQAKDNGRNCCVADDE